MRCERSSIHRGGHPMNKKWMTFVLAGLVSTAGCSKDVTAIDAAWYGTYHLLSVDGNTPPYTISATGADVATSVKAMTLNFTESGWTETDEFIETPINGQPHATTLTLSGTATRNGNKLTFVPTGGDGYGVTADGNHLTFGLTLGTVTHTCILVHD